jgi:hypothetical protein
VIAGRLTVADGVEWERQPALRQDGGGKNRQRLEARSEVEAEGDENSALGTQDSELWVEVGGGKGKRVEVEANINRVMSILLHRNNQPIH